MSDQRCLLPLLFPFGYLDVNGGEVYLSIFLFHCFSWIWLVRPLLNLCWPCGYFLNYGVLVRRYEIWLVWIYYYYYLCYVVVQILFLYVILW
jgi:hypothetical protein